MRMMSVLFGILSIFFVYKISKLFLRTNLQVLFVLVLFAFSPLNIYYSQEVRMLNLNLFLCLGSVYYFFSFIYSGDNKSVIFYIIFTSLALYTHYFSLLILFTELLVVLIFYFSRNINTKILKKYFIYFVFINILYLPWYPVFFNQTFKGQPWRTGQSFVQVGANTVNYFKDIFLSTYYSYENAGVYYFSNFLTMFIFVLIIFSLFKILNSGTVFKNKNNSIIYLFFIPLIIAVIISFNNSILFSRYLSITVPYLLIMIIYFLFENFKTRSAVIISLFLLLTEFYGSYINFNNNFKNNDYRRIISYIESNFKVGDEIIAEPHFMGWSINYHIKHSNSELSIPKILGWNLNMQIDSLKKETNINSVWLIIDYSSLQKNNYDSLSILMNQIGFTKIHSKSFYVIPEKVKVEYYKKP